LSAEQDLEARARELADRVLASDIKAAARLMRLVDDAKPLGLRAISIVHREGPEGRLVGVTGAPGAGKSTLIDQLIRAHRARGERVGVVAIDPTSPISGGAVLADRVRMVDHALDDQVFIRSLASRGLQGGLSASASMTARIMESMGASVVLMETVGIGQSEVDIARVADSLVVVIAPGMGDDVQAMKAGLLEVPDVFVVNKADREGADLVVRDLEAMIHLGAPRAWSAPVLKTIASKGDGIAELLSALDRHRSHLESTGELAGRRKARAKLDLEWALMRAIRERMLEAAGGEGALDDAAERIRTRASDLAGELENLGAKKGG
jgi:LAO/AO transport system kinase